MSSYQYSSDIHGTDWLPDNLKPYGHLGVWHLTQLIKPIAQNGYIQQILWWGRVQPTRTTEKEGVQYYCNVTLENPDNQHERFVRFEQAGTTLAPYGENIIQGWAGVVGASRVGLISFAVESWYDARLEDERDDEHIESLYQVIDKANKDYEDRLAKHLAMGGEIDSEIGWRIPIQPGFMEKP